MLELTVDGGGKLVFEVRKLLNAGYAGRNQEDIQKHIDELKKHNIAAPERIPTFFLKPPDRITAGDKISVLPDNQTSGEAEYVLLFDKGKIYVAVGSDHTDREVESYRMIISKQICPNVISPVVWRYEDVKEYWDELLLKSWVEKDGKNQLYQETRLTAFLKPEVLIDIVKTHLGEDLDGLVLYGGTVGTVDGELIFGSHFAAELIDERTGKSIRCDYAVEPMTWFKGEIG